MYDTKLPNGAARPDLLGPVAGNEYFVEHRDEWLNEVTSKLESLQFPMHLWPQSTALQDKIIYQCKAIGKLPRTIFTEVPFVAGDYSFNNLDPRIARLMSAIPHLQFQFFVFTDGDDWWPYEKSFLVDSAETFLRYCTYDIARLDPTVLDCGAAKRGKGRPKDVAAHAAKEGKASRYRAWLASCASYRALIAEKEEAYIKAKDAADSLKQELQALKAQGAPKWTSE